MSDYPGSPAQALSGAAILMALSLGSAEAQNLILANDLKGSLGIHDPSTILKDKGTYYVWGTHGSALMSKDRKNWTRNAAPNPAREQPWWARHGGDLWAPEVHYMNGFFYYYYSVSAWMDFNSAIGVTRSPTLDASSPEYEWADLGVVIDSAEAQDGGPRRVNVIDPGVITDSDGRHYLIFGSFQGGVRMAELNPETGLLKNRPSHPTVITDGAGEGSAAVKVGNYYYYAVSQGTCCANMNSTYRMTYARATRIAGPYTTRNGGSFARSQSELLLSGSNNPNATSGAVAVGVGGFFWDGADGLDTLFMDYMAYTAPGGGAQLRIHPLYLDAAGWLTFDKSEGTLITRPTPTTSLPSRSGLPPAQGRTAMSARVTGMERRRGSEILYDITGKKISGGSRALPAGVYIVKPAPDRSRLEK